MDFYLYACGFGGKGIRTPGLLIANETLYQLSYTPELSSENIMTWRFVSNRNHTGRQHPGWSCGCVSAVDSCGRTIWIADAHRGDGKRFVVRADEKLTAFLNQKQEAAIAGLKSALEKQAAQLQEVSERLEAASLSLRLVENR